MEFNFRNTEIAKRAAKRLKKTLPELKLSQAQEIVARVFGYSNWHQFHTVCENNRENGMTREAAEKLLSDIMHPYLSYKITH